MRRCIPNSAKPTPKPTAPQPSAQAQKAVAWARNIANGGQYTYKKFNNKDKKSKDAKKVKDVKKLAFGFTVVKNVTAQNGQRTLYARILKPDNSVMGKKGTFPYENTNLEYTEKKYIDYTGEEEKVTMYSDVTEFLEAGTYKLFIFCDNQMIGQTTFTLK